MARKGIRRKLLILIWILLVSGLSPVFAQESGQDSVEQAAALFGAAQRSEVAGDSLNAYLLYVRAAALDPGNAEYEVQRRQLRAQMERAAVITDGRSPVDLAGLQLLDSAMLGEPLSEAILSESALPPPKLEPAAEGIIARRSFDLRGSSELIFEEVGGAYGLVFVFGQNYQDPGTFDFRVRNSDWREALHVLEVASNSFIVPVGGNVALVFRDAAQQRGDQSPLIVAAIPIPERMSIQEAQEMASGVQQTMELNRIVVDAGRRTIFVRDTEVKVLGARKILSDLTRPRAQIAIEVEILSVSKRSSLTYGLSLPSTAPIVSFSDFLNNTVATAVGMATFGAGQSLLGIGIADAAGFATLSRSSAESALRSQLMTLDGQQTTFHLGDRYPIVVGRFGDASSSVNSTPQIQYVDLGLQLDITPAVHDGEITLVMETKYSLLSGTSNNDIPVISNRELNGTVRLKLGEWAVIAGLAATSASDQISGIPLLSQIPWAGRAFRKNTQVDDESQILIVVKPHLVSSPPWEDPTTTIYVGTETTPVSLY